MRTRLIGSMAVAVLAASTGTARADDATLTVAGPATLVQTAPGSVRSVPQGFRWPTQVLTGFSVDVGAGGQAGMVRPLISLDAGGRSTGDPVQLPAEPGTYTFAVAPVHGTVIGLVQATGRHAIVVAAACGCDAGYLDTFPGDPPADTPVRTPRAALAIAGVAYDDADGDLVPDQDEHTDLRLTPGTPTYVSPGVQRIPFTITNAGPRTADEAQVVQDASGPVGVLSHTWEGDCSRELFWDTNPPSWFGICNGAPLAPGESRGVALIAPISAPTTVEFLARAEGPDVNPDDNRVSLQLLPIYAPSPGPTPLSSATPVAPKLSVARRQRLAHGIAATITLHDAGQVTVKAGIRLHGRTLSITRSLNLPAGRAIKVTLHPSRAQLRRLRGALPLKGTLSVGSVSAPFTLRG
jgi:hypothetical protein